MVKQWRNEDIIAPSDAQRWEDGIEQSQQNNEQNSINLKKHEENINNPHGVTAGQTGAYTKEEVDSLDSSILEVAKTHIDDHAKKKNNPHGVTASQIGVYTKAEADGNSQSTLTAAKDYADTKNEEANAFTTQEIEKSKLEIQSGNVATASKLQTARKIAGNDFDGTRDIAISANDVGAYTKAESDKKLKEEIATSNDNLKVATRNYLLDSQVERMSGNEFLNHTSWDLAPLIDEYGMDREYTVSFDLKAAIPGTIQVYSQNGSAAKYDIGRHLLNVTTEYQRFSITFKPKKAGSFDTETRSLLAFFGTYDTGRIPTVRNVSYGLGNVGGDWMPNPDQLALKSDLEMTARNLVPNSSFYSDAHGWAVSPHLTATFTGEYTRVVKSAATSTRVTISRNAIDDRFKTNTEYTLGLMVYVESFSLQGSSSSSTAFLRTNNGAALDAPLGTIDWSKVGEWQLVTGTGTTRPGTWANQPQITIAIGENTICAFRIKEFSIVEGKKYLGWSPAPEEVALRRNLVETQQKVQVLEENTIRLTNQFPDPDFSKATPRPVAEGGIGVNYNDGVGVVLNNPTAVQGRIYWGSPPLGLMVGKTYNVSMYLNAGGASAGRVFIAGTSTGDNFSFSVPNDSPVWVNGTIRLTNWSAFSVWLPPNTSLRIRELYIYEANTDITTARIERLEKDNSLPRVVPAFATGFMNYNTNPTSTNYCSVERDGDGVTIRGAITNTIVVPANTTYVMCTLPVGYRPDHQERQLMQGSGAAKYLLHVETNGEVTVSRYSGHSQVGLHDAPIGSWLTTNISYKVGG